MTNMRQLCLSKYTVVLQGKEWCSSVPPSSKQASTLLENNESVVSWLSPKEKNTETEHQIPAILFQGAYWTLSLRMSKSIYRHVRLSQDFQNVQRLHGVQTLRIPRHLLREKQRTQARFERMHQDRPRKRARTAVGDARPGANKAKSGPQITQQAIASFWDSDIPTILDSAHTIDRNIAHKMQFNIEHVLRHFARDIVAIFPSATADAVDIGIKLGQYVADASPASAGRLAMSKEY